MQIVALVWGMLSLFGMLVAFIPLLGWMNWINIPFAFFGAVVAVIALTTSTEKNKAPSAVAVACCAVAVPVGLLRLFIGGGIV